MEISKRLIISQTGLHFIYLVSLHYEILRIRLLLEGVQRTRHINKLAFTCVSVFVCRQRTLTITFIFL